MIKKDYDHIFFTTDGEVDSHRLKCHEFTYSECCDEFEENEDEYEHLSESDRKSLIYDEYVKQLVKYYKEEVDPEQQPEQQTEEDEEDEEDEVILLNRPLVKFHIPESWKKQITIQDLPNELQNKIFYYVAEHPCARLIKELKVKQRSIMIETVDEDTANKHVSNVYVIR